MAAVAVAAAKQSNQPASRETTPATARPPVIIDPQLFMSARRGDSRQLKDLLQIKETDEQQLTRNCLTTTTTEGMSVAAADVIVEVDPRPRPPDAVEPPSSRPPLAAGVSGSFTVPLVEDGVTIEGDSLLHVVAACGDGEEFLHCAKMIVCDKAKKGGGAARRLVLQARNSKGNTPLHCAAAAGNADMISCLVALTTDEATAAEVKALVRMQNELGETALHQAVRAAENKLACIDQLMAVDSDLACVPQEGTSPLYLAITLGEMEIARWLLDTSKGKLSYSGPGGRNVLHAAVPRGPALAMVLEWLRGAKSTMSESDDTQQQEGQGERHVAAAAADLLSRLAKQRDSKHGSTPLHLAASLDGWDWFPVAGFLSRPIWSGSRSATTLLLGANISTAYMADDEGSYPIHVAAHAGSLGVVKMLLQRCPDCATLRDGSNGRTFLHVAATMGRYSVVKHACKMPDLSSILNAQDRNGDTALHSAIRAGNLAVFNCLFRNRQVRLDVPNKEALTPLDLSWSMIPSSAFHDPYNPRHTIRLSLLHAGAPHGECRPVLFREIHMAKRDVEKESEKLTDVTQVMSIAAVLIAAVTFASAFTLPGGYRADGTPTLAWSGSYIFGAFVLADTLAFICSCVATLSLVYAGLPHLDISTRKNSFDTSVILLLSAGRSFVAAFALGLYLMLAPVNHTIAVAVCVIIFASLLWGNKRAFCIICLANTLLARIGIRPTALFSYVQGIFISVLVHFGSYIIIFGLPAIHKWTR